MRSSFPPAGVQQTQPYYSAVPGVGTKQPENEAQRAAFSQARSAPLCSLLPPFCC